MRKPFVLNDERKKNNYGFKVLNSGIELDRFKDNPICLNDHRNNTKDVLGTWDELRFEGALFLGSPDFDTQDIEGLEVVRKVNAGKLKGCSLGFDFNPEDFQVIDGELVLTKCELKEISIVAVPSNSKTIALYDRNTGEILNDEQIKQLCLKAQNNHKKPLDMNKLLSHLQLADNADESAVLEAVKSLEGKLSAQVQENETLKSNYQKLLDEKEAQLKADFVAEKNAAVKDGRIDAASENPIEEMALKSGYETALAFLKSIPKREPVSAHLKSKQGAESELDNMSWEELDKKGLLPKIKSENPDYFKSRYKQKFGKDPK